MAKVLEKYTFLLIIFLLLDIVSLYPLIKKVDYSMTLPGGINKVERLIEFENTYQSKGSFNTTYVIGLNKLTMYQYLVGMHGNQFDISKNSSYYSGFTNEEHSISGKVSHVSAIENSLISAFREAKKSDTTISFKYEISGLILGSKPGNYTKISMGGLVYNVDGYEKMEMIDYLNGLIEQSATTKVLNLKYREYKDSSTSKDVEVTLSEFLGLSFYRKHNIISSNPTYKINTVNVGGPSGGLLNALSIYDHLIEKDITYSKKIAGTGTISVDGKVGAIGGMEQKIYTAQKNKVDYFLVPFSDDLNSAEYKNYLESMKAYKTIKKPTFTIIPVRTFEEALAKLEEIK